MAIITATEFKVWRGISGTDYDALLAVLIPGAQANVETWTGRTFDTATFTEYYDGNGSEILLLKNPPIASITSIAYCDSAGTATSTFTSTDYAFDPDTGEVRLFNARRGVASFDDFGLIVSGGPGVYPNFSEGFRNVKVVYVGGYGSNPAAETMDLGLKQAMYEYVNELFNAVKDGSGDSSQFASERLGDYQYTRGTPEDIERRFRSRFTAFRRSVL